MQKHMVVQGAKNKNFWKLSVDHGMYTIPSKIQKSVSGDDRLMLEQED